MSATQSCVFSSFYHLHGEAQTAESPVHRSSNNFLILGIITASGILYVRVWKGWNLGDLMYVTKASLQQSVDVVTTGARLSAFGPCYAGLGADS